MNKNKYNLTTLLITGLLLITLISSYFYNRYKEQQSINKLPFFEETTITTREWQGPTMEETFATSIEETTEEEIIEESTLAIENVENAETTIYETSTAVSTESTTIYIESTTEEQTLPSLPPEIIETTTVYTEIQEEITLFDLARSAMLQNEALVRRVIKDKGFSDRATHVWIRLHEYGFSDAIVAGIMGNMWQESHIDPGCTSKTGKYYGLCQWDTSSLTYINTTFGLREPVSSINGQLELLIKLMPIVLNDQSSRAGYTYEQFFTITDPQTAAFVFSREYEQPPLDIEKIEVRMKYAQIFYDIYKNLK